MLPRAPLEGWVVERLLSWQSVVFEAFAAVFLDPVLLHLRHVAQHLLAIIGHDLLGGGVEVAATIVVGALGDRRGHLLVREHRLARRLQAIQHLGVETPVALRHVLPIAVLVQEAVIEDVYT